MVGGPHGERLIVAGGMPPTRLARNAAAGASRHLVSALLALAVTPFTLRVLGPERFGLWAIGGAVLATVRLLDLGIERAVARYVATAHARRAPGDVADAVGTALPMTLGLGGLAVLVVWLVREPLVARAFGVAAELRAEAVVVVVGCALVAWLEGAFVPYRAALDGVGRMDIASGIDAGQRGVSALATVGVLALGGGLAGLVAKNLVTALGAGLLYRRRAIRQAPTLAGWPIPRRAVARELLAFGRHVQTVNLGAVALDVGAKVLLARSIGLAGVAVWELAIRVTQQLAALLLAAVLAVFPAAAALRARPEDAGEEEDEGEAAAEPVRRLYGLAARAMTAAVLAGFGLLAVLAGPFVTAWLGPGHEPVARTILILSVGWSLAILSTPAAMVVQAAGSPRDATLASLATPIVGLGVAGLLVPRFGLDGVALGVAAGLVTGGLAMAWRFKRAFRVPWRALAPLDPRTAGALAIGLAAAALAARMLPVGIVSVAVAVVLGTLCALGVARLLGVPWPRPDERTTP